MQELSFGGGACPTFDVSVGWWHLHSCQFLFCFLKYYDSFCCEHPFLCQWRNVWEKQCFFWEVTPQEEGSPPCTVVKESAAACLEALPSHVPTNSEITRDSWSRLPVYSHVECGVKAKFFSSSRVIFLRSLKIVDRYIKIVPIYTILCVFCTYVHCRMFRPGWTCLPLQTFISSLW